eukprot:CAMPEP_0196653734 /NCGR_PEP_ID=MMETSP1086-20130531/3388_1 /TAXON_ID=77921 /ORGANISM="Cyanoptyche  gloeocystis , Strain SAG4.97" /LENGTH=64 /DNA_ID=CAMNT_0041985075 /DNA_START=145 /DNA_END=339 /DNA_ORIENTATION=-
MTNSEVGTPRSQASHASQAEHAAEYAKYAPVKEPTLRIWLGILVMALCAAGSAIGLSFGLEMRI